MQVGGVHQVMLEVRVAEMSRNLLRRLGVNFSYLSSNGQSIRVEFVKRPYQAAFGKGFQALAWGSLIMSLASYASFNRALPGLYSSTH